MSFGLSRRACNDLLARADVQLEISGLVAGRTACCGDGGARGEQQHAWARRADKGVSIAPDAQNLSAPLPGEEQTSGRAELRAILCVLREAVRLALPVEILTDYELAVNLLNA